MTAEVISLPSKHTDEFQLFPVKHPRALLLSLVAGDRLIFQGRECWPWADSGVAPSPPWGISGYTICYCRDASWDEPSNLWFVWPGFEAQRRHCYNLQGIIRKNHCDVYRALAAVTDCELLPVRKEPVAAGIMAIIPVVPPQSLGQLEYIRDLNLRMLAALGGVDAAHPTLLMSTDDCPHPFSWGCDITKTAVGAQ